MSNTLNHLFGIQEQICYVQCGYCTTILLVSVPNNSMEMMVTVRCGHCSSLLSVNMMKATFVPLHLLANSLTQQNESKGEFSPKNEDAKEYPDKRSPSLVISSDEEDDDSVLVNHTVNKPPQKKQRAPSAYNNFIKEEIKRLKGIFPNMTHKEAFSAAAKNWSLCPPGERKIDGENYGKRVERKMARNDVEKVHNKAMVLVKGSKLQSTSIFTTEQF